MRKFLVGLAVLSGLAISSCRSAPDRDSGPGEKPVSVETGNLAATGILLVDSGFSVDTVELDDRGCPPDQAIQGQQVVFKDASGQTVGAATLNESEKVHQNDPPQKNPESPDSGYPIFCGYRFSVNVPPSDFYAVTFGDGMETTVSRAELDQEIVLTAR